MSGARWLLDPAALALPWSAPAQPLAFVELARIAADTVLELPPFPVIGLGDPSHPAAARLDTVVEPPVTLDLLAASIVAQPLAAAVLVQLLRLVERLEPEPALVAESLAYGLLQGSASHAAWQARRPPAQPLPPGEVATARAGDLLTIRLERAYADNAIDRPMRDGLRAAFELAALDRSIARILLRAAGRSFSLGADLAEFGTSRDPASAHAIRQQTLPALAIARCADRLEVHVQGACVGAGLENAAFARRLTASRRAWFHLPELAMGLVPGAGGCVALSRRIGRQRTALMVLSGRRIPAATALAWGLVDALVDDPPGDEGQPHIGGSEA